MSRRARLIGIAITLCTITALPICTVIAILFSSAMLSFFFGLLWFLRKIFLATASLRSGRRS